MAPVVVDKTCSPTAMNEHPSAQGHNCLLHIFVLQNLAEGPLGQLARSLLHRPNKWNKRFADTKESASREELRPTVLWPTSWLFHSSEWRFHSLQRRPFDSVPIAGSLAQEARQSCLKKSSWDPAKNESHSDISCLCRTSSRSPANKLQASCLLSQGHNETLLSSQLSSTTQPQQKFSTLRGRFVADAQTLHRFRNGSKR